MSKESGKKLDKDTMDMLVSRAMDASKDKYLDQADYKEMFNDFVSDLD
jgi:hypothetical protein